MGILIDEATCIGCGLCEYSCAWEAIDVRMKARVDNGKCTNCNVCVDYCPVDAIAMEHPAAVRTLPQQEATFDVVVIGSGVGGLSAAALLARRGYKTLVLERTPSVGGRYSSLKHKKLMVPSGGSLIQIGSPVQEVFDEVGAKFDVVAPGLIRYWVRDRGWIDPGAGGGQFRRALNMISGEPETVDLVMGSLRDILTSGQYPAVSMLDWLHTITDNEGIEGVFSAIAATAFGPEDVPAANFFALLALTSGKGVGLAQEGGIRLMGKLAKVIVQHGGEVWTRAEAKAVAVDGGAASVILERKGQSWRIKARAIISNAGPKQTTTLVGTEHFDSAYLSYLDERVKPMSVPAFHLISDRSLVGFPGFVYAIGTRRICTLFEASLIAGWAPQGVHITEIYPFTVPNPDMKADPRQWADETEMDLDDIFPGWRECSELKVICFADEYPGNHTWTGLGASVETPISNLFLVGDGCESLKGYAGGTAAAESAQRVAALVQERFPLAT